MEQKITVPSSNAGQRLDKFVLTRFSQYSRAYLKKQIKLGNFLIGNKKIKPSYVLRQGDQVALAPGLILPPNAARILPNPAIKLNIIFENDNVIVINKPAGLAVHPRQDKNGLPLPQETNSTLVSGLLAYYPAIINVGDNPLLRPGLVHRLDKDTSGVMIIAKNQPSFEWLKKQFKERKTTKKYIALAHGLFKEKQGEIKTLLARAKKDPTKQKVVLLGSLLPSDEGKVGWGVEKNTNTAPSQSPPQLRGRGKIREAITQYKVIKEFQNYTLLEAGPKTGRLHQIRVHLAHIGHPIVNDSKYGNKRLPSLPVPTRQFLHAQELKITLPSNQKKVFTAPLPNDLKTALNALERIQKL